MIVAIQGTRNFNDYSIFLRAMGTAMSGIESGDDSITVFSAGPAHLNSMGMEFVNVSERSLKARGIKIKLVKVPPSWIEENINKIDYFAFFSKPKETLSPLVDIADAKGVEVGVYRY
ncbi:MAG: hypothetical protein ACKOXV_02105 [Bacteroidota bacterium]